MICPKCGSYQTICKDSRQREGFRARRYLCQDCGERIKTREYVIHESLFGKITITEGGHEIEL